MVIKPQIEIDYKRFIIDRTNYYPHYVSIDITIERKIKGFNSGIIISRNLLKKNTNIRNYVFDNLYKCINPEMISGIQPYEYLQDNNLVRVNVINSTEKKLKLSLIIQTSDMTKISDLFKHGIENNIY